MSDNNKANDYIDLTRDPTAYSFLENIIEVAHDMALDNINYDDKTAPMNFVRSAIALTAINERVKRSSRVLELYDNDEVKAVVYALESRKDVLQSHDDDIDLDDFDAITDELAAIAKIEKRLPFTAGKKEQVVKMITD